MKLICKFSLSIGAFVSLLFLPALISAQDKLPGQIKSGAKTDAKSKDLIAQLEKNIPQLMKDGEVPGLSIAVIRDAKVVWQRGFGIANSATNQPVGDDTIFEAASLSKPVFAYGVLRLVEKGKLDLDTPLVKYLPKLTKAVPTASPESRQESFQPRFSGDSVGDCSKPKTEARSGIGATATTTRTLSSSLRANKNRAF